LRKCKKSSIHKYLRDSLDGAERADFGRVVTIATDTRGAHTIPSALWSVCFARLDQPVTRGVSTTVMSRLPRGASAATPRIQDYEK
jgi:hypothetical protein